MGKQRQAVGKRGESKTISSTSEETDKKRRRVIDTVQQVQRESHAGSSNTDLLRSRTAARNPHVAEAS